MSSITLTPIKSMFFPLFVGSISFFLLAPSTTFGYPVLIKTTDTPALVGLPHANMAAFATPDNGKSWVRTPAQIDEVEDDAFLILRSPQTVFPIREKVNHPPAKDPFEGRISRFHRIALNDKNFYSCDTKCMTLAKSGASKICEKQGGATGLHAITTHKTGRSAFLTFCNNELSPLPPPAISFSTNEQTVTTPQYSLQLSHESPFLMNWMKLNSQIKPIIQDTELGAKLKTKLLVTLNIGKSDLGGKLASVSNNRLATSLEVATTEKVMGFKLVEQVCCDMSFFEDAFYFPVLLNIPSAVGKLRNGSEVSFSFHSGSEGAPAHATAKPPSVILEQNGKYVAVAFRPTKRNENTEAGLLTKEQLAERGLTKQNAGMNISLDGAEGEQRFEAWFYTGNDLDVIKEYAANGVRYSVKYFP